MQAKFSLSVVLASAVGFSACAGGAQQGAAGARMLPNSIAQPGSTSTYIQHIVIMVQENHSFDNFFATFPGADGATEGLMQTPSGDVEVPLQEGPLRSDNLGHQYFSFKQEYDHGKMDGFNLVSRTLKKGTRVKAGKYPYRYVNPSDIAPYWSIAQNYVLADKMFTTQGSSSFTGHQDLIAGGTPVDGDQVIDFPVPSNWGCTAPPGTVTSLITPTGKYKRGKGPYPCFSYKTIRDLLDGAGLTWLYFTNMSNSSVWNAFDAISAVRNGPEWTSNIVRPETQIFDYISNNQLPSVSWVIPEAVTSDHPGNHPDEGPSWVASVVNAIGESPYWPSTMVIVVWDDWGGQYDHVAPPQVLGQGGLGMRVPMLIVSAYDREANSLPGYISHTQYEDGSILKFMENNWGLGRLGTTDVNANSISDSFDFQKPARSFIPIASEFSIEHFKRMKPSNLPIDEY